MWLNLSTIIVVSLFNSSNTHSYDYGSSQIHSESMSFSTYIRLLLRCRFFDGFSRHPTHNPRVKHVSNARLHAPLAFGCMYAYDGAQGGERCMLPASCGGKETKRRQLIDAAARCGVAHRDVAVSTIAAAANAALQFSLSLSLSRAILNVTYADNAPRKISSRNEWLGSSESRARPLGGDGDGEQLNA